jgi:DNA-binding transcriptional ArsR family regulator
MKEGPDISRIAALIGDPGRANILTALMAGKALTASELAEEAGVSLPTASGHLAKLAEGGLITGDKQGRHRYFRLAGPEAAQLLEALMGYASGQGFLRLRTGPKDQALREARVCYNHLAGRSGVQMFDFLRKSGFVTEGEMVEMTAAGAQFVTQFGVDLVRLQQGRGAMCLCCLDWSERRSHLAGSLGRALLAAMEAKNWLRREPASRALSFSPAGVGQFAAVFN